MAYAQKMVNVATYFGAKEHAMAELGKSEEEARVYAEAIVRQTQSAGGAKDMAAIQRGGEGVRLLTMFMTYFNVLYNRLEDVVRMSGTGKDSIPTTVARLSVLVVIPAILEGLMRGEPPDTEDDETWAEWIALKVILYGVATVPLARDVVSGALSKYGYSFTPISRPLQSVASMPDLIGNLFDDEEMTDAQRRALVTTLSAAFKLPASQINRILDYVAKQREGEIENPVRELLFGVKRN
jgi:hypothetical protein